MDGPFDRRPLVALSIMDGTFACRPLVGAPTPHPATPSPPAPRPSRRHRSHQPAARSAPAPPTSGHSRGHWPSVSVTRTVTRRHFQRKNLAPDRPLIGFDEAAVFVLANQRARDGLVPPHRTHLLRHWAAVCVTMTGSSHTDPVGSGQLPRAAAGRALPHAPALRRPRRRRVDAPPGPLWHAHRGPRLAICARAAGPRLGAGARLGMALPPPRHAGTRCPRRADGPRRDGQEEGQRY